MTDPRRNFENELREELDRMDMTEKIEGRGAVLVHGDRRMYVSGYPYLFSGFAERAYVFKNRAQAAKVLRKHSGLLEGFHVLVRDAK